MKKILSVVTMFIVIATSTAQAQNLKDILADHFEAVGQKKLKKVETLTLTGKLVQSGLEIPFKQISSRPSSFRIEGTFQGMTFVQTYNGTEAWILNPFAGTTEAEPVPEDQMKSVTIQADMDGMLWDWKDKGYEAKFDKLEDVEGTSCYKIDVTTKDTSVYSYFIDVETNLILKTHIKTKFSGVEVESDTYFSNYMQVDGLTLAGKIENRYNGQTGEVIVIDKYEFDLVYDAKIFDKPVAAE